MEEKETKMNSKEYKGRTNSGSSRNTKGERTAATYWSQRAVYSLTLRRRRGKLGGGKARKGSGL